MRVLRPVIEIPMLAMFHAREDLALGSPIALEFIRDDDPGNVLTALEELAEELLGGPFVPSPLHQNVELHAVLIHGPPQIVPLLINRDEDLIQVPLITRLGTPAAQVIRVLLAKLAAPFTNGFVRDDDATDEQELFHVAMAQREAEIQPDGVADDLPREPVVFIEIGRG
jgi:hypothetical protein